MDNTLVPLVRPADLHTAGPTHVPEAEVRAYDSRVGWVIADALDLGLIIIGEEILDLDILCDVEEAFVAAMDEDLVLNVDVLDWHRLTPLPPPGQDYGFERIKAFRESLERNYEVIQAGKSR